MINLTKSLPDDGYCTAFARGEHRYIALYTPATRSQAIATLLRWAESGKFNLRPADVLRISLEMPGGCPSCDCGPGDITVRIAE